MKFFPRCPLVSATALATYLVVHVVAGVLHHHGAESLTGRLPASSTKDLNYQTTSAHEDDDEETCVLCSVLHLAQILPSVLQVAAVAPLNGERMSATAIIRPYPLQITTYTRGPPLI